MAKKPMLTKLEFAKQMSIYANISVTQANACIEFYSYVIEEAMKNDLDFQIYDIGKLVPKLIEQKPEREGWNSFTNETFKRPEHGDFVRVAFRPSRLFAERIREATEKPFDPSRTPKPKKNCVQSEEED